MLKLIKKFFHWLWYGYEPGEYVSERCLRNIRYNLGKEIK